ncbi:MAG: hypothetical protein ACK5U4_10315, partial [Rhodospirillales bacterium]
CDASRGGQLVLPTLFDLTQQGPYGVAEKKAARVLRDRARGVAALKAASDECAKISFRRLRHRQLRKC